MVGPVGSGASPGSHAAQFSKTAPGRRGIPRRGRRRFRRDQPVYRPAEARQVSRPERTEECSRPLARGSSASEPATGACRPGARTPSSSVGRQVERLGVERARRRAAPPPWPISRRASLDGEPELGRDQRRQVHGPVRRRSSVGHRDLVRELAAHVDRSNARLGRRARPLAVRSGRRAAGASSRLASTAGAARDRAARRAAAASTRPSPSRGCSSASRTSPPAGR